MELVVTTDFPDTLGAFVLILIGLVSVAALMAIGVARLLPPGGWTRAHGIIATMAVLQLVCINALWLYNDRYYVVLAPLVAIIAAQALDVDGRAKSIASALLVVWAGIAITGTRDMLAFNDAVARLARETEASRVMSTNAKKRYAEAIASWWATPE